MKKIVKYIMTDILRSRIMIIYTIVLLATSFTLFSLEDNYILFSDLTISDGSNFLFINKKLFGDESEFSDLETALEKEISAFEIQKKLLEIDYFKLLKDEKINY